MEDYDHDTEGGHVYEALLGGSGQKKNPGDDDLDNIEIISESGSESEDVTKFLEDADTESNDDWKQGIEDAPEEKKIEETEQESTLQDALEDIKKEDAEEDKEVQTVLQSDSEEDNITKAMVAKSPSIPNDSGDESSDEEIIKMLRPTTPESDHEKSNDDSQTGNLSKNTLQSILQEKYINTLVCP